MNNHDAESRLQALKNQKSYRPTVVCIIENQKREFLLVRSSMNINHWYPPQGGVKVDESVQDALFRELYEELGIMVLELSDIQLNLHYGELTIKNYDLGDYSEGKAYFFVYAKYRGPGRFILKKDEVSRYRWADLAAAKKLFSQGMKAKATLIMDALKQLE